MTGTHIDTRRLCVESWPYRVELFQGDGGDKKFSNGSKGFYCYVSTRFKDDDWVAVTDIRRDRDSALKAAEILCKKHWKFTVKKTLEKNK